MELGIQYPLSLDARHVGAVICKSVSTCPVVLHPRLAFLCGRHASRNYCRHVDSLSESVDKEWFCASSVSGCQRFLERSSAGANAERRFASGLGGGSAFNIPLVDFRYIYAMEASAISEFGP